MHFGSASSTLTGLSPSGRDNMDPIAELLSQLSSVRNRAAAQSVSSQLQQLEMQLQSTRFLSLSGRQQLERIPRRQMEAGGKVTGSAANNANTMVTNPEAAALACAHSPSQPESQFLLAKLPEDGLTGSNNGGSGGGELERLEKNMFVQELLLSTLTERLQQSTHTDDPFLLLDSLRSPEPESQKKNRSSTGSSVEGSGNQGTRGSSSTGSPSSTSMGREGAGGGGGKNVASEGHCKNKNASSQASSVSGKSCGSAVSNIPSNSSTGRPAPGLSSLLPAGASISVEGRMSGAGTSSAGLGSPPSPHSLLSSRPPLLPSSRQQPPSSPQPQPHGSTVNLNEHAMGLSPRQAAAASMSPRDASHLKRSMLKHLPASRGARDMDPPPH
ncbi:hypothetical protein ACOMHN_057394 [Nucella lapillus]